MAKHRIHYINIAPAMKSLSHGTQAKTMFVCHETVSHNVPGLSDITGVEGVLQREGYGIHGITDKDGHKCWAKGCGEDVFWHAGDVNGVAVGVENVSEIPILIQNKTIDHAKAHVMWMQRTAQLSALAILLACWHNANPRKHPLKRSTGKIESPGVCSHWDVSRWYADSGGHWDCWPEDEGGYFPLAHVIELAKHYAKYYEF
jgi:hypothetical protein